jgi:ABC-type nickel/cobalt efflux system permease component RcnA
LVFSHGILWGSLGFSVLFFSIIIFLCVKPLKDNDIHDHEEKHFGDTAIIHPFDSTNHHKTDHSSHSDSKRHLKHDFSSDFDEKKSKSKDMSDSLTEPDDPDEVHHRATLEL